MKRFILLYITGMAALLLTACNSILDVDPKQSIPSESALESPQAIEAALNSVYAYLRPSSQYGRNLIAIPELLADNASHTNNPADLYNQYRNSPGSHMDNWQSSYYAINEANNIIKVLQSPVTGVTDEFKERISGQAHFLRALFYHNLMRIYAYDPTAIVPEANRGGVPLITEPVLRLDDITYPSRTSIDEVYRLIYSDLQLADRLLAGKTAGSDEVFYASAGAARALLSRVALYNGDYATAIRAADSCIHIYGLGSKLQLNPDLYVNTWRVERNPESVFELPYLVADNIGVNESLRATFTSRAFLTSSTFVNRGNVVVSDDLYSKYTSSDVRRGLIINGLGRNASLREMTKFISKNGTVNLDNVPVIRIPEVYLNRAEAYARSSQEEQARADLNVIRQRAGLNASPATLSGQALIDEILLQRRLELAFEGHRFFDLKRLGMDIIKPVGNVRFDEYRILAPIPYSEFQRNPELVQNFGY